MRGAGRLAPYLTALRRRLETRLARTPGLQATASAPSTSATRVIPRSAVSAAISLRAPATTSATSARAPGSGWAPARAKASNPSAIRRARDNPGPPRVDRAPGALGRGLPAREQVERQAGGRERPHDVVRDPPGEGLELVGALLEQQRVAAPEAPGEKRRDDRQHQADRVEHDGVGHRPLPHSPDAGPEITAPRGVEVDEPQRRGVEAVGRRLQLGLQHLADLLVPVVRRGIERLHVHDRRRQILLGPLGRGLRPFSPAKTGSAWYRAQSCSSEASASSIRCRSTRGLPSSAASRSSSPIRVMRRRSVRSSDRCSTLGVEFSAMRRRRAGFSRRSARPGRSRGRRPRPPRRKRSGASARMSRFAFDPSA